MKKSKVLTVGEIAESIDYGLTASARDGDGPRFLRITDLKEDGVDWDVVPGCDAQVSTGDRYCLQSGDIVFARTGATTGKSYLISAPPAGAVFASYLIRVRPSDSVLPQYLAHYFRSAGYWRQIEVLSQGAAQPGVNATKLASVRVPVPHVEEQRRIAAILDKAESARRKRQGAIRLIDAFLRSVFIDMFGPPDESSKWPQSPVENMVASIESGWSAQSSDRDLDSEDLAVLKVSAVSTGWFLPDEAKPVDRANVDRPLVFPRRGDLLFSRANTRELVAACCLVEEDVEDRFLPDKLWRVRAEPTRATNEYLCYLFRHPAFRHELTKQATGTSGSMLNISQAKLLSTPAPQPPISLQEKFSRIVKRAQAGRRNSLNSLGELDSLKDSLTTQLFV